MFRTFRLATSVAACSMATLAAACLAVTTAHAEPQPVHGDFVGADTYSTAEGCKKFAALAAGAERNISSVPETLTRNGYEGWEGGCTFKSIVELEPGKKWKAEMQCAEGAEEGTETDIFERLADGKLQVTVNDTATVLERCAAEKGK